MIHFVLTGQRKEAKYKQNIFLFILINLQTTQKVSVSTRTSSAISASVSITTMRLRGNNPLSFKLCTSSWMCQTYVSYLIKADHCDWSVGRILGSGTLAAGQSHMSVLTVHISVQCNYRIHTPQLTQTKSELK